MTNTQQHHDAIMRPVEAFEGKSVICTCANCGSTLGTYCDFYYDDKLPLTCPTCGVRLRSTEREEDLELRIYMLRRENSETKELLGNARRDIQTMVQGIQRAICATISCHMCPFYNCDTNNCCLIGDEEEDVIPNGNYRFQTIRREEILDNERTKTG